MLIFTLQLFGGKGGSTTVTTRDPTQEEQRITAAQADIIEQYAPQAIELNKLAADLLRDSYGTVQVDFNQLSQDAQNRINNALGGISDLVNANNVIAGYTNGDLETAYDNYGLASLWNYDRYNDLVNANNTVTGYTNRDLETAYDNYGLASMWNYDRYNDLGGRYDAVTQNANGLLGNYINEAANSANNTNNILGNYVNKSDNAANNANNALGNYTGVANNTARNINNELNDYKNSTDETANKTNADLSEYIKQNNKAYGTVDGLLAGLQNGNLPSAYTQNMEDTIRGVLQKTMGENLNNMAQRGVINSSVNEAAQNAIASNAASAIAQNYLNNINTISNLGQQRFQDNAATTSANAQMSQNQLDNVTKNANTGALLTQQQLNNIMNAINTETGLIQQQYGNTKDAINTGSTLAQQQFGNTQNAINTGSTLTQQQLGNTNSMLGSLGQIYNQQYNDYTNAIGQQAQLAQQKGQNSLGVNSANAGLYGNLISQSATPITTAAGAQEAAQSAATNLWNASMGLTNSGNSTLSAIAAANPNQTTTTTTNGGGFWGGLLGGVGSYLGAASAACFPEGTLVKMAGGSEKDISEIEVGDEVIDKDGKTVKVILLLPNRKNDVWELTTKGGAKTRTTATQPFLLEDGRQKELRYLTPNDVLLNMGEIESIRRVSYERVYDFETDGSNTYVVDGGFIAQGGGVEWWKEDKE